MTRRRRSRRWSGGARVGRLLLQLWWVLVAAHDVLMGAYLWDTEGAGPIVVSAICVALVVTFSRSRRRSRH